MSVLQHFDTLRPINKSKDSRMFENLELWKMQFVLLNEFRVCWRFKNRNTQITIRTTNGARTMCTLALFVAYLIPVIFFFICKLSSWHCKNSVSMFFFLIACQNRQNHMHIYLYALQSINNFDARMFIFIVLEKCQRQIYCSKWLYYFQVIFWLEFSNCTYIWTLSW